MCNAILYNILYSSTIRPDGTIGTDGTTPRSSKQVFIQKIVTELKTVLEEDRKNLELKIKEMFETHSGDVKAKYKDIKTELKRIHDRLNDPHLFDFIKKRFQDIEDKLKDPVGPNFQTMLNNLPTKEDLKGVKTICEDIRGMTQHTEAKVLNIHKERWWLDLSGEVRNNNETLAQPETKINNLRIPEYQAPDNSAITTQLNRIEEAFNNSPMSKHVDNLAKDNLIILQQLQEIKSMLS